MWGCKQALSREVFCLCVPGTEAQYVMRFDFGVSPRGRISLLMAAYSSAQWLRFNPVPRHNKKEAIMNFSQQLLRKKYSYEFTCRSFQRQTILFLKMNLTLSLKAFLLFLPPRVGTTWEGSSFTSLIKIMYGTAHCWVLAMCSSYMTKTKLNSMVWVRERTIPTERPPLVGEAIANFCG
jgi:hypothetical protein